MVLVGGTQAGVGNVYARNPVTGIYGPVCDDFWNMLAVRNYLKCFSNLCPWELGIFNLKVSSSQYSLGYVFVLTFKWNCKC